MLINIVNKQNNYLNIVNNLLHSLYYFALILNLFNVFDANSRVGITEPTHINLRYFYLNEIHRPWQNILIISILEGLYPLFKFGQYSLTKGGIRSQMPGRQMMGYKIFIIQLKRMFYLIYLIQIFIKNTPNLSNGLPYLDQII